MDKNSAYFVVVSFIALMLLSNTSLACIGLVAGPVHLNVSAGYGATGHVTIFNNCDNPLNFDTAGLINPMINQTTPNITTSPKHGVLVGHEQLSFNVTVFMPPNAIPGTNWTGGAVAMEVANASIPGAANLQGGVTKIITITTLAAPVNFLQFELLAIAVIIIVVLVMLVIYLIMSKKRVEKKHARIEKKLAAIERFKPPKHGRR
ncbi:MAG: hypothetical protein ABSD68_03820 [Candidatus Micrarchaeales archaeon]